MVTKKQIAGGLALIGVIIGFSCFNGLMGKNDDQNYVVLQSLGGKMSVVDKAGWYVKSFGTPTVYPRYTDIYYSSDVGEGGTGDQSIKVVFNAGGKANVSVFTKLGFPIGGDDRLNLHRVLGGNPKNVQQLLNSSIKEIVAGSATLMSASECQSSKRTLFGQLIERQLVDGQYAMRSKEESALNEDGTTARKTTTAIVNNDDGTPRVAKKSPLSQYGLVLSTFAVNGIDYDKETEDQFMAKKDAKNKAELAKIQAQQEVQDRLKLIEKGKKDNQEIQNKIILETTQAVLTAEKEKQMAEIEAGKKVAVAREAKIQAEVLAQQQVSVAKEIKLQAEVMASQKLSVAEIAKAEAEMKASEQLAVAEFNKKIAIENAEAMKIEADAKKEQIEKSGALSERDRLAMELDAKIKIETAQAMGKGLSEMILPTEYISMGGGAEGGVANEMSNIMNLFMLNQAKQAKTTTKKVTK
jgi:hypothetical protein